MNTTLDRATTSKEAIDGKGGDIGKLLYIVFSRAAKTEEFRQACYSLVTEIAYIWAKDSGLKRTVSRGIEKSLRKGLLKTQDVSYPRNFVDLFEDPEFIKVVSTFLPAILDKGLEISNVFSKTIEKLSAEEKGRLFQSQISDKDISRTGELFTSMLRIVNDIHGQKPVFYADKTQIVFKKFIESIDFGELKEALDGSVDHVAEAVEGCNEELWQYPAKVVAIFSLLPTIVNLLVRVADNSMGKLNEVAPDLLTDIVLSFIKEIDFKNVGMLINQTAELVRKIHTGSALLGEPERPQFSKDLDQIFSKLLATADAELLLKSRSLSYDARASLSNALWEGIEGSGDVSKKYLEQFYLKPNQKIRETSKQLSMFEQLDDEDAAECVEKGLSSLDVQEVAEIVNMTSLLVNRVASMKPKLIRSTVSQLSQALDLAELAEAAKTLVDESTDELESIFRATVPGMIVVICKSISEKDDEFEGQAREARRELRELLLGD